MTAQEYQKRSEEAKERIITLIKEELRNLTALDMLKLGIQFSQAAVEMINYFNKKPKL